VAIGTEAGRTVGVVREEGQLPYPVAVLVVADLPAHGGEAYAIRAGASRRLRPDADVIDALSADPATVTVETSRHRLVLTAGACPDICETDVVLLDAQGKVHVVRVVVN
jgi:hypothetical protein